MADATTERAGALHRDDRGHFLAVRIDGIADRFRCAQPILHAPIPSVPNPLCDPAAVADGRAHSQCLSGYLLMKPFRFGICTFGKVSAFIVSLSPMTLLRARI